MITKTPSSRKLITGLEAVFNIFGDDYSFHDTEFECFRWQNGEELVIKFNDRMGDKIYYIVWHITPEPGCQFKFFGGPYDPYVFGIDIEDVPEHADWVRFKCEGDCGLIINATAIHVEVHEIPEEDYKLFN